MSGFRLALGMFSVFPAGRPRPDPGTARTVLWMPLVGLLIAGVAVLAALLVWHGRGHGSTLVAAVVVIGVQALLTRGLHLDGLADLADGLGSGRPADGALAVMRQPDIGPFGVAALVLVVLVQASSLAAVLDAGPAPLGVVLVVVAAVTARLAVVWTARRGVPPARPDGFGALVAGSVGPLALASSTVGVVAVAVLASVVTGASAAGVGWLLGALLAGLLGAVAVSAHAVRRLGGVTGDVFGAVVEIASTFVLLVLAAGTAWR